MEISRKDVIWNYAATFLKLASSILLLPIILRMMPSEMVGIWMVFVTISAFSTLIDFGFSPSFTRNISYVFSGVKSLQKTGYEVVDEHSASIDYGLLKGIIYAMRWIYARMALFLLLILISVGSFYIHTIIQDYTGSHSDVYIAWVILCLINTYNLYTLYYDSLLQGKGLIKKSKQIIIIGQLAYLLTAMILLFVGKGLIAVVCAQVFSVVIIRWLSHRTFFTSEMKMILKSNQEKQAKEILSIILPNSLRIGATSLGSFIIQKSSIIIGSLFLSLNEIASYGITFQIITVLISLAGIYTTTYMPKIVQLRVLQNKAAIKYVYIKGEMILISIFLVGGMVLLFLGQWALNVIGSSTQLLQQSMLFVALLISFFESNHSLAGSILLTKNEVPFFKASLVSAVFTIIVLVLLLNYSTLGLWAMVIAPGIVQGAYQNWKWPLVVCKDLAITRWDILKVMNDVLVRKLHKINTIG
jgi:O-antigen/teichoic acid export membrane protein